MSAAAPASRKPSGDSRRPRQRAIIVIVVVLAVVLGGATALIGFTGLTLKSQADALRSDATALDIEAVADDLDSMRATTEDWAWSACEFLPFIGGDYAQIRTLITSLDDTARPLLPELQTALGSIDTDGIGLNERTIAAIAPVVTQAIEPLSDLATEWEALPPLTIGFLNDQIGSLKLTVIDGAYVLDNLEPLLTAPQELFGDYLVLAMTNSEIKTMGGYPGAWVTVTLSDDGISVGEIKGINNKRLPDDITAAYTDEERAAFPVLDNPDASSSFEIPLFRRTGDVTTKIWEDRTGVDANGVIALDPIALARLVDALTDHAITTSEGTTIESNAIAQQLLNGVYLDIIGNKEQDAYFGEVATAAMDALSAEGGLNMSELVSALADSIRDGHLLLYSADDAVEDALETKPIGGDRLARLTGGTFGLYFNDRSMSKLAYYLDKDVSIDGDRVTVKLTNSIDKKSIKEIPQYIAGMNPQIRVPCDLLLLTAIYAPEGGSVENVEVQGMLTDARESTFDGHQFWSGVLWIFPGETITFSFTAHPAPGYEGPIEFDTTFLFSDTQDEQG